MRPFDLSRDSDLYVEGYCESFRESYPGVSVSLALEASYRESLANLVTLPDMAAYTIDSDDGEPIGFVVLALVEMEALRQLSIEVLYVKPGHRGSGLGRQLLEAASVHANALGARATRLDVSVSNKAAVALYGAAGYVITRYQMERLNAA